MDERGAWSRWMQGCDGDGWRCEVGVRAGQRGVDDKKEPAPWKKRTENAKKVHGGAGRGSITRIVSLLSLPTSGLTDFQTIVAREKNCSRQVRENLSHVARPWPRTFQGSIKKTERLCCNAEAPPILSTRLRARLFRTSDANSYTTDAYY